MKSQHDNKEIKNQASKINNLFHLESSKLIITSKGDLGHHCIQINVQMQSKKTNQIWTVQRDGIIKEVEITVMAA